MHKAFFLGSLLLLSACASAAPAPAPIAPDPIKPPGSWEMSVADQAEPAPPPPVNTHECDKPNVASRASKRSLFALPKKTKE
jgi:hypothetical protein